MKIRISILLVFFSASIFGQQFLLNSQPQRNLLYINPAYTGFYEATALSLMHRSNWIVDNNASREFQNAEFHAPLKNQSIALGLQLKHEKEGGMNRNEVFIDYAHRIEMGSSKLALGLKAGGVSIATDKNMILPDGETYDPNFSGEYDGMSPNFGVGISYYSKTYFAGISVPYLLSESEIEVNLDEYSFVLSGGGNFEVSNKLAVEPSGLFIYSLSLKPAYQFIVNANYNKMIVFGAGYRSGSSIIANAGFNLNAQISLLYSYDYNIGEIAAYSSSSHEIGLLWYFGYKIKTSNSRDF